MDSSKMINTDAQNLYDISTSETNISSNGVFFFFPIVIDNNQI